MKFATIREFRTKIHSIVNEQDTVVVTRHGKPVFFGYPWGAESEETLDKKRHEFKKLEPERKKMFSHIDEKEMLKDFAKWRKNRRRSRR
jgi:hypothetical protein